MHDILSAGMDSALRHPLGLATEPTLRNDASTVTAYLSCDCSNEGELFRNNDNHWKKSIFTRYPNMEPTAAPAFNVQRRTTGMPTGADLRNECREDTAKVAATSRAAPIMRAAVTTAGILLSLARSTDAFAPFSVAGGSAGMRRTASAACTARTVGAEIGARKRKASYMMAGDAATIEQAVDGDPVDVTKSSQAILNNDMNPFVTKPRRDPREWFDGLREQARPRPAGIAELSR